MPAIEPIELFLIPPRITIRIGSLPRNQAARLVSDDYFSQHKKAFLQAKLFHKKESAVVDPFPACFASF